MKTHRQIAILFGLMVAFAAGANAQQTTVTSTVPRLIQFSGAIKDAAGKPVNGPVPVTFSLFAEQEGGTALWSETQTVDADAQGRYSVFLGAMNPQGLPLDLFTTGAARWLAVETPGQPDQPRVLLVGVPYALKAADADTLGGKPASAFVTIDSESAQSSGTSPAASTPVAVPAITPATAPTGSGTTDYVPLWTSSTNLGNSILFQNSGAMEVQGALELPSLGMANASGGYDSQPFDLFASAYNSSSKAAVEQHFRWEAEPVSNDTSAPAGKVDLLYASGTSAPTETGLSISSKGILTFATGQTLPAVTGNETVSGNVSASQLISTVATGTAPLKVTSTTEVANLNAALLDGLSSGTFATHGANAFTGTQTITGNLNVTGSINSALTLQGNLTDSHTGNTSANVIQGFTANTVNNGATGATINGGGMTGSNANTVNDDFGTVGGGAANSAGQFNISGGYGKTQFATVAGGGSNTANNLGSVVGGGYINTASGTFSTVPGGYENLASGPYSFAGGYFARASDTGSFVWCQQNGSACSSAGTNSFVVSVTGPAYFAASGGVGIGTSTPAAALEVNGTAKFDGAATFAGGVTDTGNISATGQLVSTVATGTAPLQVSSTTQVSNLNASLLDGLSSSAFATYGANTYTGAQTINGALNLTGSINSALTLQGNVYDPSCLGNAGCTSSNVIGGWSGNSVASGIIGATIAGGGGTSPDYGLQYDLPNTVGADFGTVGGGVGNAANGYESTVAGGVGNGASGEGSTVPGGFLNTASGAYSLAAGYGANATDPGSFVWCQQNLIGLSGACNSAGANSFVVSVNGPIYFYDSASGSSGPGCMLSTGSSGWSCFSDRNLKSNIRPIDSRSILEGVARMPVPQWSIKADAAGHNHIGPMAQDFYAAFGLGDSNKYIAQGDAQGVALASIQALYQMVREKDEQIQKLVQEKSEEIDALRKQLQALEERLGRR